MKKRLISWILTACMLLGMAPTVSIAAGAADGDGLSGNCGENLTWSFDESSSTLTISGTGEMETFDEGSPPWGRLNVEKVIIENGVTSVAELAFSWNENLKSVFFPDTLISIGDHAFDGCSNLSDLILPNGLKSIGSMAFWNCDSLSTIYIPQSVTNIGDVAFTECSALTTISVDENNSKYCSVDGVLYSKDQTILECYPAGKSGTSYTIASNVTQIMNFAFWECHQLQNIYVDNGNLQYSSRDGIVYSKDGTILDICPPGKAGSYNIPDNVNEIAATAFYSSKLENITLPESVKKIGQNAFERSYELTSVNIPSGITEISDYLFWRCEKLEEVTIPTGVTQIGEYAFSGTAIREITIPAQVTRLKCCTFYDCPNLVNVTIPNSVTYFEEGVFLDCSHLTNIYYSGNEDKWNAIKVDYYDNGEIVTATIGELNEFLPGVTIHYNSDGSEAPDPTLPGQITGVLPGNRSADTVSYNFTGFHIGFDKDVAQSSKTNYASLDFSAAPFSVYRSSDDQLIYQVKENNDGYSLDVLSYESSSPDRIIIQPTNAQSLLEKDTEYYITMGEGFVQFKDGTSSTAIEKGAWTFRTAPFTDRDTAGYSFLNSANPNSPTAGFNRNDGYRISGDYLNALEDSLGPCEHFAVSSLINGDWSGHCYGMSAVYVLQKTGNIDLSFYQSDVKALYELDFPKKNTDIFNLLTYYHLQQKNNLHRFNYDLQTNADDNVDNVIQTISKETPPTIIELSTSDGRHAVVGLGVSVVDDIYQIPIWDPNYFETDLLYVNITDKEYWLESDHYEVGKVLAATTLDMLLEYDLEQQLREAGNTSMARSTNYVPTGKQNYSEWIYLITNYEDFTIEHDGLSASIVDGTKVSGNLNISDKIYLNEMGADEKEYLFGIDAAQLDTFTVNLNDDNADYALTRILYNYDQPSGIAYSLKTNGVGSFTFSTEGILNTDFTNKMQTTITTVRNTTSNAFLAATITTEDNIVVKSAVDCVTVDSADNATVNVAVRDIFSSTDLGYVAIPGNGISIQSLGNKGQILDSTTNDILSELSLNHSITFNSLGGTLLEPITNISYNSVVQPPQNPQKEGYTFDGWYLSSDFNQNEKWDFATPVTSDLELYAKWAEVSDEDHEDTQPEGSDGPATPDISEGGGGGGLGSSSNRPDASVSGEGGSVSASSNGTVTIIPDEGYEIASITINGEEVSIPSNGILTGLDASDEVIVTFAPITEEQPDDSMPFTDVADGAWYADAVQYMLDNGMMNGTTATTFSPDETTTRAMIVTILHRLENEPSAEASGFTDVAAGSYYADAVNWAAVNGIVNGVSETSFAPDDAITREQMAAILYRYAQFKGYDTTVGGMSLSEYADASQISAYATTAMQWANAEGLITGVTNTTLSPQGSATRAQVATILMRFVENIAK